MVRLGYLWVLLALISPTAKSQVLPAQPEHGRPLYRMFSAADYNAHGQNFGAVQDKKGLVYFANFAGVLEYDGVNWKTIPTENVTRVSAIAFGKDQRILVGANGEFGYLAYDSLGTHRFVSLSSSLKVRPTSVLQILPDKNGAWFVCENQLFHWNGKQVTTLSNKLSLQSAFVLDDQIIAYSKDRGPLKIVDGHATEILRTDNTPVLLDIVAVVGTMDNALLFTSGQGVFRLINGRLELGKGSINPLLTARKVTAAGKLPDGTIAVGLGDGGMVVASGQGEFLYPVSAGGNLQDSQISTMLVDRDANLWLTLNDGIAKFDLPSPISVIDAALGLKGAVTTIARFKGSLYAGTLFGLYRISDNKADRLSQFSGSCLGLEVAGDGLWVASNKGLYRLGASGEMTRINSDFSLAVAASPDGQKVYVGLQDGLMQFIKDGSGWRGTKVKGIEKQITGMQEFPKGTLWLETLSTGIIRRDANGAVQHFSAAQGISSPLYNKLSVYDNRLLVTNQDGIFELNGNRFARTTWPESGKVWFDRVQEGVSGSIWTTRGDKKSVAYFEKKGQDKYERLDVPFMPISEMVVQTVFPENNGIVWLGTDHGLVRLDMVVAKKYQVKHAVILRNVTTSLGNVAIASDTLKEVRLPYKQNSLVVEYALPSYNVNQETQYQYFLENFDKGWSEWGAITRKEFSGLPPGNYVFRVRAKDIYDNVSTEASLSFKILTPWFLQWYMLILYAAVAGGLIWYGVRWRLGRILREKKALETLIRERTEEVVNQKEELETQSEELSATNDQLERIDEFVKAINSEVNTQKLFQLVLDRICGFQNVDAASGLVYNKATDNYQFIALSGAVQAADVEDVHLSLEQLEQRYVDGGEEVYEDIFLKNNFRFENLNSSIDDLFAPKSLITILIRVDGYVRSVITMENMDHENAFGERDFNMVRNLKEHLIGAYIKTNILENLENTLENLKSTQEELIRQERLASVGQLTKGIVDRILNPLNYINNFSQSSGGLLTEIEDVTGKHIDTYTEDDRDDLESGMLMLRKNLEKIHEHGNSTTRIVKDMQKLLKGKSTEFLVTELNPFVESRSKTALQEVLNEYKGVTSVALTFALADVPFKVSILPFEFSQVLGNLISNAVYAVLEKQRIKKDFVPKVEISTRRAAGGVIMSVGDNGSGIPVKEVAQLFSPFFTTKPTSKGTGLGLYMSKDIIEYHKGRMTVNSKEGEFTVFEIFLPTLS